MMTTTAYQTASHSEADQAYQKELTAARANIVALQAALAKHAGDQRGEPNHWGYAGELADMNKTMRQMAAALNGDPRWDER